MIDSSDQEQDFGFSNKFGDNLEFEGTSLFKFVRVKMPDNSIQRVTYDTARQTIQDIMAELNSHYEQYYQLTQEKGESPIPYGAILSTLIDENSQQQYDLIAVKGNRDQTLLIKRGPEQEQALTVYVKTLTGLKLKLEVFKSDEVRNLKAKIQDLSNHACDQQRLMFGGKQMQDSRTLANYNLSNNDIIHLVLRLRGGGGGSIFDLFKGIFNYFTSNPLDSLQMAIEISQEGDKTDNIVIPYPMVRMRKVRDVIRQYVGSSEAWSLTFHDAVLAPYDNMCSVQSCPKFNRRSNFVVKILKTSKIFFSGLSQKRWAYRENRFKVTKKNHQKAVSRIKEAIKSSKILEDASIVFYTCEEFFGETNKFLRDIHKAQSISADQQELGFAFALIKSLNKLDPYFGEVHRGMNGFTFSDHCLEGSVYHFSSFFSTSIDQNVAKKFLKGRGTLFHIKSVTGRNIEQYSIFPKEREVLFQPYTYFIVEKIIKGNLVDEVWLGEMPSPASFKMKVLVWVDDKPQKNYLIVREAMKSKVEVQILQLTSTQMAEQWQKEFLPLIEWKRIPLRVVTNMVRFELGCEAPNYYAGVELLNLFSRDERSLGIPLLIFCRDKEQALKNLFEKGVEKERKYKVCHQHKEIMEYIGWSRF